MSVFVMKMIALASMLTDHLGYFLYPLHISRNVYFVMRVVGRIAFPVYCFLIVNGFQKTHDVKKYLTRLISFAAISQIPFVLSFDASVYIPGAGLQCQTLYPPALCLALIAAAAAGWLISVDRGPSVIWPVLALGVGVLELRVNGVKLFSHELNVFYTLALGLSSVAVLDGLFRPERNWRRLIAQMLALAAAFALVRNYADYRCVGAALIVTLYLTRHSRAGQAIMIALWCAVEYVLPAHMFWGYFPGALAALAPILLYNGQLGPSTKRMFYWFYPAHLLVIGILTQLV